MQDVETELVRMLDGGRRDAAVTLALRSYGPQVYGYLVALLRDGAAADEAFAQFSEDLWVALDGFRRECAVKTYAYRIAWHVALHLLRDPYHRRGRRLATQEMADLVERIRTSTALHLQSEVKDRMAELRRALTPEEQTLLVLRVDRDLPWRDVATVLDVEEVALRKRFERLKDRLRELAREGGLLPER